MKKIKFLGKLRLSTSAVKVLSLAAFIFLGSVSIFANHPVFVEGNCLIPPAGNSAAGTGVCGDYDGDGLIGTAEDNDGDRVFGTIAGANGMAGIDNNGTITIVTSGVFNPVNLRLAGNVTLQAAPGVAAVIDAVLQGDNTNNNTARQNGNGITILASGFRRIAVKNVTIKNFRTGILIQSANVVLENVRIENNVDYGIRVQSVSNVSIMNSSVASTGYRLNPMSGDFPNGSAPAPGYGISFEGTSRGNIVSSNVSQNFARGVSNVGGGSVCISQSNFINNGTNTVNSGGGSVTFSANGCYQ